MEPFDPENDLIDKYLRGELHGAQLDTFMRKLENDPLLKKDVHFRKLLVQGIQEHGAVQLKNYLRQRTTQKRVMVVSYKTWYYAAAAVALLLVSSTVVLWYGQKTNVGATEIADGKKLSPKNEPNTGKSESPSVANEPYFVAPPTDKDTDSSANSFLAIEDASGAGEALRSESSSAPTTTYPDVVIVASNIPVIPIKIESNFGETVTMRKEPGKIVTAKPSTSTEDKESTGLKKLGIDSGYAWSMDKIAKSESISEQTTRFKLSFANTRDALPQIQLTKNKTSNELMVYNLPYDNPLILNYESKYYLKAGDKYYEINMNQSGKQAVTAVTDTALLEALNK